MEFHPKKCQALPITRNKNIVDISIYMLHGQILKTVLQSKYTGITITSDFGGIPYINNISSKANRSLSFLHRNLQVPSIKIKLKPTLPLSDPYWRTAVLFGIPKTRGRWEVRPLSHPSRRKNGVLDFEVLASK